MAECHFSWDSYKKNICNGFARLQQSEEFVDMTLAADGHLVQVHRSLVALASPYIKQMLKTAPCQNPVVFLNGVNYDILSYLLEYIYSGEVRVPVERINVFLQQAKALHIVGVENVITPMAVPICTTKRKNKKSHNTEDNIERITDSHEAGCVQSDQQNDNLEQPDALIEQNIQNNNHNSTTFNIVALNSESQENNNLNANTIIMANENTESNYEAMDALHSENQENNHLNANIIVMANENIEPNHEAMDALHSESQENNHLNANTIFMANENTDANYEAMDSLHSESQENNHLNANTIVVANENAEANYEALDALHLESQENNHLNANTIVMANENTDANYEAMDTTNEVCNGDFEDLIPNNYVENVDFSTVLNNKPQPNQEVDKYDLESLISATLYGMNEKNDPDDTGFENNTGSLLPLTNTVDANIIPNQDTQSNINTGALLSSDGIETILNNENCIPQIPNYQIELKMLTEDGQTKPQLITSFNPPLSQPEQSSSTNQIVISAKDTDKTDNNAYYMVTNKGRLQAILNRYMYYAHHKSYRTKCRWRCIEYRHKQCKAYMDTNGEKVMHRKFLHSHPFHDDLIMKKANDYQIFPTIEEALAAAAAVASKINTVDTQITDDDDNIVE